MFYIVKKIRRQKPPNFLFLLVLFSIWLFCGIYIVKAQQSTDINSALADGSISSNQGGQIFSEIMEIFAPSSSKQANTNRQQTFLSEKSNTDGILANGWKSLLDDRGDRSSSNLPAAEKNTNPWAQLTKGMFGLFQTTTRAPPTTTPSIFQTFYEKVSFQKYKF